MATRQEAYPEQLESLENDLLSRRRKHAWPNNEQQGKVGVALTGGGIRSATQALGHFQEFARSGLLRCIDFMSTVSGGGYFGGFLTRWCAQDGIKNVERKLSDGGSEVSYLRNNSNYIAPSGSGDMMIAVAVMLRNWCSVLTVMAAWVLGWFCLGRLLVGYLPIPEAIFGSVRLSEFAVIWLIVTTLAVVPLVWSYWLIKSPGVWYGRLAIAIVFGASAFAAVWMHSLVWAGVSVITIAACAWWIIARLFSRHSMQQQHMLSRFITKAMMVSAIFFVWSIADTVGLILYHMLSELSIGGLGATAGIGTVVVFSRKMFSFDAEKRGLLLKIVLPLLSVTFVLLLLAVLASVSYLVAADEGKWTLLVTTLLLWTISFIWGNVWAFINRSSFHPFFHARIARSFLGASNPARTKSNVPVTKTLAADDMRMKDAAMSCEKGGPLHIIETTINETVDGRSQLQQVHRQGTVLAVTPHSFSVGSRHHAIESSNDCFEPIRRETGYHVFGQKAFRPESLRLGQWIAISAAAASTGMGYKTSILRSLLFALLNVRMGYWWNSGLLHKPSGLFAVQRYFLREAFAMFPGTAKQRWYLTDGGHFENSAAYELVRRRLPVIVVCDGGRDPDCSTYSVGNLVRKVRIDFGANVRFLNNAELYEVLHPSIRPEFGIFDDMKKGDGRLRRMKAVLSNRSGLQQANFTLDEDQFSLCHAALAHITYKDSDEVSWMIWMFPTLTGDEPQDVLQYRQHSPSFPHESTADQLFGEDQWESYRALSQHISSKIFAFIPDANQHNTPFEWVMKGKGPSWSWIKS